METIHGAVQQVNNIKTVQLHFMQICSANPKAPLLYIYSYDKTCLELCGVSRNMLHIFSELLQLKACIFSKTTISRTVIGKEFAQGMKHSDQA
jgi:hypothetical protein